MNRTKGVSLAKGPVGIIGAILLAGGILGLLFGSTDFTTHAPNGDVTGGTWLGIEGNGWTWVLFGGTGLVLLLSATMHWSAKSMALLGGLVMTVACVLAIVDGNDVLGIFAANRWTIVAFGAAAVALLLVAMLPRVHRRRDVVVEDETAATTGRRGRFARRDRRVDEPVGTTAGRRTEATDGTTGRRVETTDGTTERPVATTDGTTERRV
jgi:hypothetical protein